MAQGRLRLAADIGGTFHRYRGVRRKNRQAHVRQGAVDAGASGRGHFRGRRQSRQRLSLGRRCSCTARPSPSTPMLERTGAKTALLITEGFRDIYEIGRINRPDAYNLFFQKHVPLIERALRFEVKERMLADGEIDTPLDDGEIAALGERLERLGVEAAAILFLNCYANADHERRAKAILEKNHPRCSSPPRTRSVAGISRVRALRDGRRQRLYRPEGAPLYRRDRRAYARSRLCRLVPGGAIDRRPLRGRAGPGASACACWNPARPPASSAPRRCAAR